MNKRSQILYIILNSNKQYLSKEIVEKHGRKVGMRTLFTGYKICEDNEKEEKIVEWNQKIYPVPENDYSKPGKG